MIKDVFERKLLFLKKTVYLLNNKASSEKKILFIVGCQRSGTNILLNTFERDLQTKTYDEFSVLSSDDLEFNIRLNSFKQLKDEFSSQKANFIILKPIVESQNVLKLLDYFPGSKALWLYRHYEDVASSNVKHFDINEPIKDLTPIVNNEKNNWRSEGASDSTRGVVLRNYTKDISPYDAAVLFWYVRNSIYFDLLLDDNEDVLLCRYEDLIQSPAILLSKVYKKINIQYPGDYVVKKIHSNSLGKGRDIVISPAIRKLADDMQCRLDSVNEGKVGR